MRGVDTLFADFRKPVKLRSGKEVEIRQGKTRHFGLLLRLFEHAINRMSPSQMARLLQIIADKQVLSIAKGLNPLDVDPGDLTAKLSTEDDVREAVREVIDTGSLITSFMQSVWDLLPEVVGAITNLSGDEWLDLDPDEGMTVVFSIVAMNYDFFFQNMPRMSAAFGGMLQARATDLAVKPPTEKK